ncbi:HAMP domain-containing sensor histidine kinase [Actinosynnema sp. NPDC051121]
MTRSSADRLRRLRLLMTLLVTGVNAVVLVVLAVLVVGADADRREKDLDADLHVVTSSVLRLIRDDGRGGITTAAVAQDELNDKCPRFAVLPGGPGQFAGFVSDGACAAADQANLDVQVQAAVRSGSELRGYTTASDGRSLRFRVEPFRLGGRFVGGVIAVSDATVADAEHDRVALLVFGGCVLLIGALGLAGHVLSGRAIRPAAAALEQQEVLLAETAHDLRTPVAALRALAETALRNPAERAGLLPRTVALAARMGSIIDGLLVRARLAAGVEQLAVQPVWLDQLVAGVVEDTPHGGASVTVTTAPSKVLVDPGLIQRAIGNLLDNALRYGRQPNENAVVQVIVANGRVTVADHGPGVDEALADAAFDRFGTGGGSSGLGLSIVRWVAQAHGGTLTAYNAEVGGAIFELQLPVVAE